MGSLLSMFTGAAAQPQQQTVTNNSGNLASSLLGSLLGGGQTAQVQQTTRTNTGTNSALSLLGSLLSTDTSASKANANNASNGTELLGLLTSLMK